MPGNPLTDPTWANETTDTVVRIVGTVRDKTTTPVIHAARGLVFGVLAAFLGLFAAVALVIAITRGLQALLDLGMSSERAVYTSYLIVGGIFCIVGLFLFKKRNATSA
jgi:hypothetical protein